jgi:hypothetical protein
MRLLEMYAGADARRRPNIHAVTEANLGQPTFNNRELISNMEVWKRHTAAPREGAEGAEGSTLAGTTSRRSSFDRALHLLTQVPGMGEAFAKKRDKNNQHYCYYVPYR